MSNFMKNVMLLGTSSMLSVVLPILISPINSRLYSSEEYGELGIFVSFFFILSVLVNSHFGHIIILQKTKVDSFKSMIISVFIGVGVVFLLFFYFALFTVEEYLYFLPIILVFTIIQSNLNYWF